jgi:hypothetical protein
MKSVLSSPPKDLSFPSVMTAYENEFGRLTLVQEIIERINYARSFTSLRNMVTRFHHELATISQIREVITTNWDDYFERYCEMQPIVTDRDYVFYNLPGRKVYKIHGSINNVSTVVATLDDYAQCEERLKTSVMGGTLRHLLGTKIVVFVGYSLKDEDFQNIYSPLIEGMDSLRPVTYIVSPFDVPDADKFKLRHIKTDGSSFLRSLKDHLVDSDDNLPDDIYERIESLRELIAKAHKITADMDWRNHPELFYSLTYQDGALDAFGKMLSLFSTGDTTNIHHIKHIWADYDKLLRVAIDKERYWDAAYIDGYRNAQICLLMEDDDLRMFPLYEFFDEDDFPPEEDSSWQPSEEAEGDNPTEEEDSEEKQVEEEAQKLPTLLSQDELLEMLAGINEQYPKLFEEANSLISSLPEGTIPQHIPFLDGVTGNYSPPSVY